ncbi:hypothetical protein [Providencia alcalifaciens]|uniref:hypothetical protein n=1 Tax=Providencia alcalifaciens TaxID=126385 RepID=UPI000D36B41B|nr:hypothetical protein [Providencia alcalifaciens]
MIKYLCALPILFSGFSFSAVNNNDMGLYRDDNYNVLALAGGYSCDVSSLPDDLNDAESYNVLKIGSAQLEITPYAGDNSAMANINFDTGVTITSPKLQLISKGSEMTMYGSESSGYVFMYMVNEKLGIMIAVQDKNKGKEISIGLSNCKYDKNNQ